MSYRNITSVEIFETRKKALMEGGAEALAQQAGGGKDLISVLSKSFSFLDTHPT